MSFQLKRVVLLVLLFAAMSCNDRKNDKPKISTAEAKKLAEKKFYAYLPKILKTNNAALDVQESHTGDFTGDGIDDVAIYFTLIPSDGASAIVGQGLTLYKNTGNGVKVIGGYEPDNLFGFDTIVNGKIHVEILKYAENDGWCCPSIKIKHTLKISGNKVY